MHKEAAAKLAMAAILALAVVSLPCTSAWSRPPNLPPLDAGYREMYNLNFDAAHGVFRAWEQAHPADPIAPVSDAAAYMFSEFRRLHILEMDLFVENDTFEHRQKPVPDPQVRAAFNEALNKAEKLAGDSLARSPQDHNAMFAEIMVNGLRGDYAAMIEKRNFAGLRFMKTSRALAEKLLSADPSYYDAYLATGVENYLLGINPAPVRWILRLGGAQTDKAKGVQQLRLTAERGHYLAPYARLLLAVAALRDKDRVTARKLLQGLAEEFPQNPLYAKELARIHP
jgi:hypothetical protein